MVLYDAVVVGLGGAGSSTAFHLARSGSRVLGLEQFGPVHSHGSSHGRTRIYRTAYSEGAAYVPLVQRAQILWHQLQRETGERVIQPTGGLVIGGRGSRMLEGAMRSAVAHSLRHEILSSSVVSERFPQFLLQDPERALWDPEAGVLFPENCVRAHASGAVEAGAELHYGEKVKGWRAASGRVEVRTSRGEFRSRTLVLTAGPWTQALSPRLHLPLQIERQCVFLFPPSGTVPVHPDRMPVFIWDREKVGESYGIPDFGDGVKVGSGSGSPVDSPEKTDRTLHDEDASPVRQFVTDCLNGVIPREREGMSCLYTNAPDHNFVLGPHPRYPQVMVVSACSGHGFKFTSVVGEILGHLVHGEPTGFDLSMFSPGRFRPARSGSKS